uniref:Immunoglobulin heavy constant epsilon n=1 Tax=Equus caballus TaxID=9796 RepID=A0A9L0S2W4_HORSE
MGSRWTHPQQVSKQAPLILPLAACCKDTKTTNITLGCLVKGYFPEPVTVTWDAGSLNRSTITFPAVFDQTSGLYTTISRVVASGKWAKQKFTCNVVHSQETFNKTFNACIVTFTPPTVKLFHSSCDPGGDSHTTIQLLCLISDYTPGDIDIVWLIDGQKVDEQFPQHGLVKQEGKLASTHSELNITQGQWASENTYTCQVTYKDMIFKDQARKCTESDPRGVSVYLSPPSPLDLYVSKSPKITCLVVDLANVQGLSLNWSRESGEPLQKHTLATSEQFNKTFSVTSTLPVDTTDWIEGETYKCTVSHPDLPREVVRSIAKAPGKRLSPEVYVFLPPEEDQSSKDKVTLTCLIQNFFPADISVQWLRNNVLIQTDQQATTRPQKANGPDPAFFVFSRLEVSRAEWEQKNKFACKVVHEALSQRTLQKEVSKDPELDLQDLCAEGAESEELEGPWTSLFVFIALFLLSVSYSATVTLFKVKWIFAAILQEKPQNVHDYRNVMQPAS